MQAAMLGLPLLLDAAGFFTLAISARSKLFVSVLLPRMSPFCRKARNECEKSPKNPKPGRTSSIFDANLLQILTELHLCCRKQQSRQAHTDEKSGGIGMRRKSPDNLHLVFETQKPRLVFLAVACAVQSR